MPLIAGKSPKSFSKNVATEMNAGKPQKQSLAIAYAMKKRAKKMAKGGAIRPTSDEEHEAVPNYMDFLETHPEMQKAKPPPDFEDKVKSDLEDPHYVTTDDDYYAAKGGLMKPGMVDRIMKKRKMAEGGEITDNYESSSSANHQDEFMDLDATDEQKSGFVDHMGDMKRPNRMAMSEDDRRLNQHGEMETGPMGAYAEGGQITDNEQDAEHMLDMVGRIIAKRQKCFSEGGLVANDTQITAGFKPANYDDLALRDDLESKYTGMNSGDEIGNAQEDSDRNAHYALPG